MIFQDNIPGTRLLTTKSPDRKALREELISETKEFYNGVVNGSVVGTEKSQSGKRALVLCVITAIAFSLGSLIFLLLFGPKRLSNSKILPVAFIGLFLLVGLTLVVYALKARQSRNGCHEKVFARCIGYQFKIGYDEGGSSTNRAMLISCPVFEYSFRGNIVRALDGTYSYSTEHYPRYGETVEIWTDGTDDGKIYWDGTEKNLKAVLWFGILWIAFIVIMFAAYRYSEQKRAKDKERLAAQSGVTEDGRRIVSREKLSAITKKNGLSDYWSVYERVLTDVSEEQRDDGTQCLILRFEPMEGLKDGIRITNSDDIETYRDAEPGEQFYWVQLDGVAMIFSVRDYYISPESYAR